MSENNCKECIKEGREVNSVFDTVGKTYYKVENYDTKEDDVYCFRHFHQSKLKNYKQRGDYTSIFKVKLK